jgi:hypothetical protein
MSAAQDRRWDCSECAQDRWHGPNAEACEDCAGWGLRRALIAYDAAPRIEAKYKPAYERLCFAARAAGMPRNHGAAVVVWARKHLGSRWT